MNLVQVVLDLLTVASKAKEEATRLMGRVLERGGLTLDCGCFVQVRQDVMVLVLDHTSPQEFVKFIRRLEEDHRCS